MNKAMVIDKKISSIDELKSLKDKIIKDSKKYDFVLTACAGTGCQACNCETVWNAIDKIIEEKKLTDKVKLLKTGCHGFCEQGPLLIIEPKNIFYCGIKPEDAERIISETILNGKVIDELLYTDPVSKKKIQKENEIPFYKGQHRDILAKNKLISPTDISDYIKNGGFTAIAKALSMTGKDVINELIDSGLRGRGGGGFLTGKKWEICRNIKDDIKYIICNADEGDPGAYMDRSILEGNPFEIIEGMLIGAYAIGAKQGLIYVRNEYPLAVEHAKLAILEARKIGLLGENILGTSFTFDIQIIRGGGAFVCGEETGLIASLEGKVGEPIDRPPFPAEKGLNYKPTIINNVETWANIPFIINNGAKTYAKVGTKTSKGTKIFALTGQIKNTGLIEVPFGATIKEIVYNIGGGPLEGRKIKAVQTGGPSGGCIPESMFDLRIDFDELSKAGSMMGSGGMVVMDDRSCMIDVAKYFLNFTLDESCGKCTVCRIGTSRMYEILDDITKGKGTMEQLELLKDTAETISIASLCALGKTAPNPVLSTLKYFENEYKAHIIDKKCPAKVCKDLIEYKINEKCIGCGVCLKACPVNAITGDKKKMHAIDINKCTKCGICMDSCKFSAIAVS